MRRLGLAIAFLASLVFSSPGLAQIPPDDLVITGAGFGHGWDTEIELADSELGVGTAGAIAISTGLAGPCPPICESFEYSVPPKGTTRILLSEAFPFYPTLMTVHVATHTEQPLPVVRARIFNAAAPGMSAEIPVFRNPTTSPRTFPVLVFPGLRRQPGVYSNLILQSFQPVSGDILIEAFASDGRLLGSEKVTPPSVGTVPLVLVDVAGRLDAAAVDGGQVRVTSPPGQLAWGVLATVYADGRLAMIPGANP
jgi:hypothetical protein